MTTKNEPDPDPNSTESPTTQEIGKVVSPQQANRILISLMFPAMLMPLLSSMSRIALPILREDFQIESETTAWIITAFAIPFMVLMPVYGRLSDGLGKRRLLLAGIIIFAIGTALTVAATSLSVLMFGRVIQGIGASGMTPLGMAFLASIFAPRERGKALGTWSSVGPILAFVGPLLAGFLVEIWGWRAAFAPTFLLAVIAFLVVKQNIPAGLSIVKPDFLRQFDWTGVGLLCVTTTSLLIYLSSRPITGVASLQDWRFLIIMVVTLTLFFVWERRHSNPFVDFRIFRNHTFSLASFCASLRMVTMGGLSLLLPLYLTDVRHLSATSIGFMAMITPGTMILLVRFGGQISDRWGSRWPTLFGLGTMGLVMVGFGLISDAVPLFMVAGLLSVYGVGAGLVLASLHRAAMSYVSEDEVSAAAGLYSMLRFAGALIGGAVAGVVLQNGLDFAPSDLIAYQRVFFFFGFPALIGALAGLRFRETTST
ncbi:MAG: MFS transporter [Chloroflexota bacterium]